MPPATPIISITEERTFTARLGDRTVSGLAVASAWEGFTKYSTAAGQHLIVLDGEQRIVTASPDLVAQLHIGEVVQDATMWATVPRTVLPGGYVVPSFEVARYLSSHDADGKLAIDPALKPLANFTFASAQEEALGAGWKLITETQWLAIAWNASRVATNWSSGVVGIGKLAQGVRYRSGALAANHVDLKDGENRWITLSNGERLCDFNGNLFSWVFDDVQGNVGGVVDETITAESISKSVALVASGGEWESTGLGYHHEDDSAWSGYALIRGGCFDSGGNAGVFDLGGGSPGGRDGDVGFRCTK